VRRALSAVIISLSILLPSAAQQPTPASPQPGQLLQSALAALGANTAIADVSLLGTAHYIAGSDDETGTATLKALAGGSSRVDLNLSGGTRTEIDTSASGTSAGTWSGPDGLSHDIAFHNLLTEPAWFFPAFLVLRGLSAPGYVANYVGHETRNGRALEHLTISQASAIQVPVGGPDLRHLAQTDLFLDSSTILPVAMTFNIHPDNNALLDIPVEIRFSDYRSVNGVQIPFHVEKFLNNSLLLDLQFQAASVNSGLSDSQFIAQ
jgi:hypothetical protein